MRKTHLDSGRLASYCPVRPVYPNPNAGIQAGAESGLTSRVRGNKLTTVLAARVSQESATQNECQTQNRRQRNMMMAGARYLHWTHVNCFLMSGKCDAPVDERRDSGKYQNNSGKFHSSVLSPFQFHRARRPFASEVSSAWRRISAKMQEKAGVAILRESRSRRQLVSCLHGPHKVRCRPIRRKSRMLV